MATNNHLLHVKSSQIIDGEPKLPTQEQIEYGELAINYAEGKEKIALKSSTNHIKTFSTDAQNETKFALKTQVQEVGEVVSKAFDTMNKSCGFNEEIAYTPQNELIRDCVSLSEAMEIVAEKTNSSSSVPTDNETIAEVITSDGTKAIGIPDRVAEVNLGYNILKKNKSILEQITQPNTIYEIRYDYDLSGNTLTMPDNCTLKFEGGIINNGNVVFKNTKIVSAKVSILKDINMSGNTNNSEIYPEWFGATAYSLDNMNEYASISDKVYTESDDASVYINKALKLASASGCRCLLSGGIYLLKTTVEVPINTELKLNNNTVLGTCMQGSGEYIYIQDKETIIPTKTSITSEERKCTDFVTGEIFTYPTYIKENEFIDTESMAIAIRLKGKSAKLSGHGTINMKFRTRFTIGIYLESWGYSWYDMSYSPTIDVRIIDGEFNTCVGDSTQYYTTSDTLDDSIGENGDTCWKLSSNNSWVTGGLVKKTNDKWASVSGPYYVGSFNTHLRLECPSNATRITNTDINIWSASGFRGIEFILLGSNTGWINSSFWKGTVSYKWGGCFSYFGKGAFEDHDLRNVNVQLSNTPYNESFRILYGSPQHNKYGTFWDIDWTSHKSPIMAEMLSNSNYNEIHSISNPKYIIDYGAFNNFGKSYIKADYFCKNVPSGITEYTLDKNFISKFNNVETLTIKLPSDRKDEEYNFILTTSSNRELNIVFEEEITWNVDFSFMPNKTYHGSIIGTNGLISGKPSDFRNDIADKCNEYMKFNDNAVAKVIASSSIGDGVGVQKDKFLSIKGNEFSCKDNTEITEFTELQYCNNMYTTKGTYSYQGMFNNCANLTKVYLPDSITEIFASTFSGCDSLVDLKWNQEKITKIGTGAFAGTKLPLELDLPNLESIGDYSTFRQSSITKIKNLGKITEIKGNSYGIFGYCTSLTEVILPETLTSIGAGAFTDCTSLTNVTFPESITTIGTNAFAGCKQLSIELDLPNLESIGDYGTFRSTSITKIKNLGKITEIKGNSSGIFANCTSLTEVILPETLTSIGNFTFNGCTNLATMVCKSITPPLLESGAFGYSHNEKLTIYVPDESVETYKAAENWVNYADKIYPLSEYVEA